MSTETADAKPLHGQIKEFFALAYDANLQAWVLVPCCRDDLLKQVTVLYSEGPPK